MLITLEGSDGVGKDTVAAKLKELLEETGHKVVIVNEPSYTGAGGVLRKMFLESDEEYHPLVELHVFVASRFDNLLQVIFPLLDSGHVVICTRGPLSTMVYQIPPILEYVNNAEVVRSAMSSIKSTQHLIEDHGVVEHKFLITCNDVTAMERILNRGVLDNFENKSKEVHVSRAKMYLDYSVEFGYVEINNDNPPEVAVREILNNLPM